MEKPKMKTVVKSPMAIVKEKFKTKETLVDKLVGMVKKQDGVSKDDLRARLLKASNKKLLKLESRFEKKN